MGAAGKQRDHERVEGDALLLGAADQVRVQGRGEADLRLAAGFGHGMNSSRCATIPSRQIGLAARQRPALYSREVTL